MTALHMATWPEIPTRAIAWAYRDPDHVAALTAWLTSTSL